MHPDQCTLVPVREGEVTSQAGWPPTTPVSALQETVRALRRDKIRVSIFIDPDLDAVRWASALDADRIELYTEPYAKSFAAGGREREESFARYAAAATLAHSLGLGINAGHDLDLDNLTLFRTLPHLDEVSIGHALISHALYVGLETGGEGLSRGARRISNGRSQVAAGCSLLAVAKPGCWRLAADGCMCGCRLAAGLLSRALGLATANSEQRAAISRSPYTPRP